MRFGNIIVILICFLLLIPLINYAQGQNDAIVYKIKINQDNSATWVITQVQDINGTIDSWDGFQRRVIMLVNEASIQTQRQMLIAEDSFQMATRISQDTQAKTTEYQFTWINFSTTLNKQITIGEVFGVSDFFYRLYGEGNLQIQYPQTYEITSISPEPNQQDDETNIISWIRTQDFINGKPEITMRIQNNVPTPIQNNSDLDQIYIIFGISSIVLILLGIGGVFFIKKHNRKKEPKQQMLFTGVKESSFLESEEEKIIKVLRSNQGTAFQSAITEQCKFSKAKTSQLLTTLEKKGIVRRYKKGRDKIVILAD